MTDRKNADTHARDLDLLLDHHLERVKADLPAFGDAFERRVRDDIKRTAAAAFEKFDAIGTSGRYTPEGERKERLLAARAASEALAKVRAETVEKLERQIAERRASALQPKAKPEPLDALLREMRHREWREHLRREDAITLQEKVRMAEDPELLDALEGAPTGYPIAAGEQIAEARRRIAEKADPQMGELAQLQRAYQYALGATEQVLVAASGVGRAELTPEPEAALSPPPAPYLLSTGEDVSR